jgi:ParB family chromosome partitioning protein
MGIQNDLQNKTGMLVTISNKKNNSGKISLDYKNIDQLNRLIKVIKDNY